MEFQTRFKKTDISVEADVRRRFTSLHSTSRRVLCPKSVRVTVVLVGAIQKNGRRMEFQTRFKKIDINIRCQHLVRALLTGSESVRQITSVCFEEDFLFYLGIAVASTWFEEDVPI